MKKIDVIFENCYGIQNLTYQFDFDNKGHAYSIYAANGFMKTSFSKTFDDLNKGKETKDLIFSQRITRREIKDENNNDLKSENIFVIEPYNQDFSSNETSLLLVNQAIKKEYDDTLKNIEKKKEDLLKKLKQLSGLNSKALDPEKAWFSTRNDGLKYNYNEEMFA